MKCDIAYYLNKRMEEENVAMCCVNTAVEESLLAQRDDGLLPQDIVIRDNIQPDDILIISVGGNDIALRPSVSTGFNMLAMLMTNDAESLKRGPEKVRGMKHFVWMFKDKMAAYIEKLTAKTKPKKVIVACIYFPDMKRSGGWADRVLSWLKYYEQPQLLQQAIREIYRHAHLQIKIPGVEVIGFPMFETLDGSNSADYVSGVEPSAQGNAKLAAAVWPLFTAQQPVVSSSSSSMCTNDDGDENEKSAPSESEELHSTLSD